MWDLNLQTWEAFYDVTSGGMFGYAPDDYIWTVSGWGSLVHPDDLRPIRKAFNAHVRGETPGYECEHRIRAKSDEWRWNLARGRVVEFDRNGAPLRMVGTNQDITERKLLEEDLRALRADFGDDSESRVTAPEEAGLDYKGLMEKVKALSGRLRASFARYQLLIDNLREGICVAEGGFLRFVNPYGAHIMGYSLDELMSRPFMEFVHPEDRDFVIKRYLLRLQGQLEGGDTSFRIIHASGETRWLEGATVRVAWEGKPAVLMVASDVTERREAEEELQRSEQLLRLTFDTMGSGLLIIGPHGEILMANLYARHCLGLDDTSIGRTLLEVLQDVGHWEGLNHHETKASTTITLRNGKRKTIGYNCASLEAEGSYMLLFRDLSALAESEERRRRAEQLALVGETAARLAHDIKNPLTSVLSGLHALRSSKNLISEDRYIVELVLDEVRSLNATVKHLLEGTRTSSMTVARVDVRALLAGRLEFHKLMAQSAGVHISLAEGPEGVFVTGDDQSLRRVLDNLVQNALDACGRGDSIRLGWRIVPQPEKHLLAGDFSETVVGISVEDTGRGLSDSISKSGLFRPFVTTKSSGSGLGLAVSQEIAEIHGGWIRVGSSRDKGTTFEMLLPAGDRPRCWESRCATKDCGPQSENGCLRCEVKMSGSDTFCWVLRGLTHRAETGVWPDRCLNCFVFRQSVFLAPDKPPGV